MTLAERLINQGIEKGVFIAKIETALRLIEKEHSDALIEDIVEIPLHQINKLRQYFDRDKTKSYDYLEQIADELLNEK